MARLTGYHRLDIRTRCGEAFILGARITSICCFSMLVLLGTGLSAPAALGQVDLEWRAETTLVRVGDTVEVGLYAVSQTSTETLLGVDAIIAWDHAVLQLLGHAEDSPFPLRGFFNDELLDRLNADCGPDTFCVPFSSVPFNDGDASFTASAIFSDLPEATPEGVLISTVLFGAIGSSGESQIAFLSQVGSFSFTRVLAQVDGGSELVTGALGAISYSIAPCGSEGDFDNDCAVSLVDYVSLNACHLGPDEPIDGSCSAGDFDSDGDTDLRDAALFQQWFAGP